MQSTPKIVDAKENLSFGWIYTSRKDYGRNWFKVIDLPDYSKEERELDNKIIKCICQSSKKSNEFYFVNYQKDESRNIEFSLRQPLINDHLLRRINHIGIVDFEAMYSAIDNLKNSKFSDEAVISKWFEEELSSSQSALAYHCGNDNIHVFASDSKFGREDDKWIDYQALDGQDFTILVVRERDLSKVSPFFNRVQIKPVQIDKETLYYLVTGQGFQYELYREKLLQPVYQQYYKAPDWLEALTIGCGFKERYDF